MTPGLRTYRFTLTRADALAFELYPRELTGWGKVAFVSAFIACGLLLGAMPEQWTEGWRFWAIGIAMMLVAYGAVTLWLRVLAHLRARQRVPRPIEVTVEDQGDHLAVTEGGRQRHIAYESIAAELEGPAHLFIVTGRGVLIMPASAFEPNEMAALRQAIADHNRDPVDGDGPDIAVQTRSP